MTTNNDLHANCAAKLLMFGFDSWQRHTIHVNGSDVVITLHHPNDIDRAILCKFCPVCGLSARGKGVRDGDAGSAALVAKLKEAHHEILRVASDLNCREFRPIDLEQLHGIALQAELHVIRAVKMLGGYPPTDKPHATDHNQR